MTETKVQFYVKVGGKGGIIRSQPRLAPRVNLFYDNGAYQVWHAPRHQEVVLWGVWDDPITVPTTYYLVRLDPAPPHAVRAATLLEKHCLGYVGELPAKQLRQQLRAEADRRAREEGRLAVDAVVVNDEADWEQLVAKIAAALHMDYEMNGEYGVLVVAKRLENGPEIILSCPSLSLLGAVSHILVGGVFPAGGVDLLPPQREAGPLMLDLSSGPTALAKAIATQFLPGYRQRYAAAVEALRAARSAQAPAVPGAPRSKRPG